MKKFLSPLLIVMAGAASLLTPLFASGDCGLNPVVFVPSACLPPYEVPPSQPTGACYLIDGSCWSMSCDGTAWGNGIPGRCGSGVISENTVPRCLSAYAVTNVLIYKYTTECTMVGNSCQCKLVATGETDYVPVCTCMDMEPLH